MEDADCWIASLVSSSSWMGRSEKEDATSFHVAVCSLKSGEKNPSAHCRHGYCLARSRPDASAVIDGTTSMTTRFGGGLLLVEMKKMEQLCHCLDNMMATGDDRPWRDQTLLVFAVILTGTDHPIGALPELR
ncbi:hypothetical protein ACLOJK_039200 [Asimina triloba]